MQDRRGGHNASSIDQEDRLKYVEILEAELAKQVGVKGAKKWISRWLILNDENSETHIPKGQQVSLISGLNMLFELPYHAICKSISTKEAEFIPYVAISDKVEVGCTVLVIEIHTKKVVASFMHIPYQFRWVSPGQLNRWMEEQASGIWKKFTTPNLPKFGD